MGGVRDFITEAAWKRLVEAGEPRSCERGSVLMTQGEVADSVLVLLSGRVKILRSGGTGESHLIAVRGEGELLGEIAMLGDGIRTATVVALDDCLTRVLELAEYRDVCAEFQLADGITRHLVHRMSEGERLRMELAALPARPRLLSYLLGLARTSAGVPLGDGLVDVGVGQRDLIMGVGLSRSMVASELARLKAVGVVTRSRAPIVVNVAELRRLVGE